MTAPAPLPSRLATGALASFSVDAVLRALGDERDADPDRIALAYRSERLFRIDGGRPEVWSPRSGFWRTRDGWVRTHGNYPHHAAALRRGLALTDDADADAVRTAIGAASVDEAVARITRTGGMAVAVRPEDPSLDAALRSRPLVEVALLGDAAAAPSARPTVAPLTGIRVLDLTRVIAGPVCTRTLALLGAVVLRIDPPHLPEPEAQHLDTGHGKRSALLDARSEQMTALLDGADVVVLGYRPAALARLGLSPEHLAARYPGLVIAQLSAWGAEHPDRAGFDSLVQAECGIAMIESADGETPGALPAQALDHSAGYLLAAAVVDAIARRRTDGGTWHVSTSLRRVAAELLGMPRSAAPAPERPIDPEPHRRDFVVDGRTVMTTAPVLPGFEFAAPRPWGRDAARW